MQVAVRESARDSLREMAAAKPSEASQPCCHRGSEPSHPLRVVSWNIGLRGLATLASSTAASFDAPDVHGISRRQSFGSLAALLAALDADIVCFQEVKLREMERHLALVDGWDSYFSLCRAREPRTSGGRYAGVATFCRTGCRPRRA